MKSHSEQFAAFEARMMEVALEFGQSDDPIQRGRARAIRELMPACAQFVGAEMERGEVPGITMIAMVNIFATIMGSVIKMTARDPSPEGLLQAQCAIAAQFVNELTDDPQAAARLIMTMTEANESAEDMVEFNAIIQARGGSHMTAPDAVRNEELEAHLLEVALKFDQSKDPVDHVRARAIRAFGVEAMGFLHKEMNARRKDVATSQIMAGVADILGSVLSSVNSTAMSDGQGGRAPVLIDASPHDPFEVVKEMASIMVMAQLEAAAP